MKSTAPQAVDADTLEGLDLFRDVDPERVLYLLENCTRRHIRAGEMLLDPSMPNETVYLVARGALHVRHEAPDGKAIAVLDRGACAGEMSMIEGVTPNAWVVALEDSELLCLGHVTLWALINSSHAVARNLLTVLLRRVHTDKQFLRESSAIVREYRHRALTDSLTDLYSRHGMEQIFPRAMSRCLQERQTACLIVIDIDHFRDFNNQRGHLVGDEVLVAVADQIQYGFRPTDLKARYGGDEFTVLLPNTALPQALKTAERVRLAIRGARPFLQNDLPVTVTMGVSMMLPQDDLERLFARADAALFHAKQAGRDRVSI